MHVAVFVAIRATGPIAALARIFAVVVVSVIAGVVGDGVADQSDAEQLPLLSLG